MAMQKSFTSPLLFTALGAVLFIGARLLFLPEPHHTHAHANMAVVINGQKVDFSGPQYMEPLSACGATAMTARDRVHMHDSNGGAVHVHDDGVIWAHFFQNIGWTVTKDSIQTDQGTLYREGNGQVIRLYRNGKLESLLPTQPVEALDKVLVYVGPDNSSKIEPARAQVPTDASEYEGATDGAGCSTSQAHESFGDRLLRAIWVSPTH